MKSHGPKQRKDASYLRDLPSRNSQSTQAKDAETLTKLKDYTAPERQGNDLPPTSWMD